ncbi:MAG: hypothetical protein ABIA04_13270 [Pseudomonadota bacterium]
MGQVPVVSDRHTEVESSSAQGTNYGELLALLESKQGFENVIQVLDIALDMVSKGEEKIDEIREIVFTIDYEKFSGLEKKTVVYYLVEIIYEAKFVGGDVISLITSVYDMYDEYAITVARILTLPGNDSASSQQVLITKGLTHELKDVRLLSAFALSLSGNYRPGTVEALTDECQGVNDADLEVVAQSKETLRLIEEETGKSLASLYQYDVPFNNSCEGNICSVE